MVLLRSHDALTRFDWDEAPLREVIDSALKAHGDEPGRRTTTGPSVLLRASMTVIIFLAFHKLATNAQKYGEFSIPASRVNVRWTTTASRNGANRIDIVSRESGGPIVQSPKRYGFGTTSLEKGMPLGGRVPLTFHPGGAECHICLPPRSGG
jgi:chemotaxis family two-component system sensor kinase Cph1